MEKRKSNYFIKQRREVEKEEMRVIYAESKQNLSNMTYGLSYILMNVSFIKVMCFLFYLLCCVVLCCVVLCCVVLCCVVLCCVVLCCVVLCCVVLCCVCVCVCVCRNSTTKHKSKEAKYS